MAEEDQGSIKQGARARKPPKRRSDREPSTKPHSADVLDEYYVHARVTLECRDRIDAYLDSRKITKAAFLEAAVAYYMDPHGAVQKEREAREDLDEAKAHIRVLADQLHQATVAATVNTRPFSMEDMVRMVTPRTPGIGRPRIAEAKRTIGITLTKSVYEWLLQINLKAQEQRRQDISLPTAVSCILKNLHDTSKKMSRTTHGTEKDTT